MSDIDLSGGLTPLAPPNAIDLTAGLNAPPAAPPTPPPPEQKEGFGGWLESLGRVMRPVSMPGVGGTVQADLTRPTIGAGKFTGSGVGGLMDLMHWLGEKYVYGGLTTPEDAMKADYRKQNPNATDEQVNQAYEDKQKQSLDAHMKDISGWLRKGTEPHGTGENIGYFGAMAAEPKILPELSAEDLLQIAGSKAMPVMEKMQAASDLLKSYMKNPNAWKYTLIGMKAAKTAAEEATNLGAQTYLHTEDPEEARKAALLGAGAGVVAGGLEVGGQAWREKFGTKTIKIGPYETPALARQVNDEGFAVPGRAEDAPKIQAAQEAFHQNVVGHTAREATRNALTSLNNTRPILEPVTDEARLLAAPEQLEQPEFIVWGQPGVERQEGELLQEPRKKHIGTKVIERAEGPAPQGQPRPTAEGANIRDLSPETGEGPALTGGRSITDFITGRQTQITQAPSTSARRLVKEPQYQYLAGNKPGSPEPRQDILGGGVSVKTKNVQEAEAWLRNIEDQQSNPDNLKPPEQGGLTPEQHDALEAQRKNLQDQLDLHYSAQRGHPDYTQRFQPIDVDNAMNYVHTFGDGSAQVEAAAKPVYQRLDQVSNGEFNKLRQQAKAAKNTMKRAGSIEAYETAEQRYYEANNAIGDLIDKSSPHLTQQDYQVARNAYRQSRRLDELDTVFERMMNGVTYEEGAIGMPRYIEKARTKPIQNYLDIGTNQQQIEELIGREGIINLKNVTNLLSERATSPASQNLMKETMMVVAGYLKHGGYGAAIGGLGAKMMGGDPFTGAVAGGITADALRWGWRYAATTPKVGQMIDMAVRNQVSTKIAAPLIARAIAQAAGLYKPGQEQAQPQPAKP